MKYLIAIFAIIALVNAKEEWSVKSPAEMKAIRLECLKENALDDEYVKKLQQFEFPDVEPVRKHLLCAVKKMGVFCEHEGYNVDRIAKQFKSDLDEAEVLAIAKGCMDKNEQGSSADVWAYRGHKCLISSEIGEKIQAHMKKQAETVQ